MIALKFWFMLLSTFILIILAKKNYFNLLHLIMYLFSGGCFLATVHTWRSEDILWSGLSPSTMWVLGTKLAFSVLASSVLSL